MLYIYNIFKEKKLMQWLKSSLQLKGHGFEPFFELFFHPQTKWMKINYL